MSGYVWTLTIVAVIEILSRTYRLTMGTWKPSTREDYVVGLCVWIVLALWGLYLLARGN